MDNPMTIDPIAALEEIRARLARGSEAPSLRAMSDEGLLGSSAEAILDSAAEEIGHLRMALKNSLVLYTESNAENERLRKVLRGVEWGATTLTQSFCPCCGSEKRKGHNVDCELRSALQGSKTP